jgi:hypothetical protein
MLIPNVSNSHSLSQGPTSTAPASRSWFAGIKCSNWPDLIRRARRLVRLVETGERLNRALALQRRRLDRALALQRRLLLVRRCRVRRLIAAGRVRAFTAAPARYPAPDVAGRAIGRSRPANPAG